MNNISGFVLRMMGLIYFIISQGLLFIGCIILGIALMVTFPLWIAPFMVYMRHKNGK